MRRIGQQPPLDEILVLECQAGSEGAFEQLARMWHARLLFRAKSLVGEADGAQEVVQEAWLAIARGLRGLKDPARFGSWSYRIVRNKAVDWIRSNQRRRRAQVESDVETAPAPDSASAGDDRPRVVLLRSAIRRLSPDHRQTVELFYLDELSVREIARLTGVPEGTVKSRLFHARESLRKTLEEHNEPES